MTRQPVPAPKTPRPIRDDPHAGQLYVTAGFWWTGTHLPPHKVRHLIETVIGRTVWVDGLSVAVRVEGAAGEAAEMEGEGP